MQFLEMVIIEPIRDRDIFDVEAGIPSLVSPDEQDGCPPGIESVQDTQRPSGVLHPKLPHLSMTRTPDIGRVRKRQVGPKLFQQPDFRGHGVLLAFGKFMPPPTELVRDLHFPSHD